MRGDERCECRAARLACPGRPGTRPPDDGSGSHPAIGPEPHTERGLSRRDACATLDTIRIVPAQTSFFRAGSAASFLTSSLIFCASPFAATMVESSVSTMMLSFTPTNVIGVRPLVRAS